MTLAFTVEEYFVNPIFRCHLSGFHYSPTNQTEYENKVIINNLLIKFCKNENKNYTGSNWCYSGTLAMTMVMFIGPFMGLPKMNPAAMLSMMMGVPVLVGWSMHFMIGIIFALGYVYLLLPFLKKVKSKVVKGIIFGISVFVFAQIMIQFHCPMRCNIPQITDLAGFAV